MKRTKTKFLLVTLSLSRHFLTKAKLMMLLVLMIVFQVKANAIHAQEISINVIQTDIASILKTIEKQQNCRFMYRTDLAELKRKVDFKVEKKQLKDVLVKLFEGTNLRYKLISSNLYAIYQSGEEESYTATTDGKISGRVTSKNGEPLQSVVVSVKGKNVNTLTNENGSYSVTANEGDVLVFSYVGYNSVELKASTNIVNVVLVPSYNSIEEVVVVGYGTQKKKDLTGSVSSVKGEALAVMPSTNPLASMQGKVPGLTISNSGRAGSAPVVRIRGVNSTNSANPVYVVDGVMLDNIDFLNPADIETIDVLRDPSSIAIYGLRGANGVIAVTTKKAARGKTIVSLQSNIGVQVVNDKIKVTDAAGFKKLYTAQLANLNAAAFDYTNYNANTNWQDLVLRNALITSHNLSVSNSGDKSTTYFNVGYTKQQGVLKNDTYDRYLLRLSQELRITSNFKIGGGFNTYHYTNTPPAASISNALWAAPIVPIQLDANTYYSMPSFQRAQVANPVAALNKNDGTSVNKGYRVIANVFAEWKFKKHALEWL